ncbi:hypothetical protein BU17DRAFT_102510 [Hysterangium stoloniferum]|nr:hypothetical protein BU17DRAFT_102510 [Hysterangium stoloniferum]
MPPPPNPPENRPSSPSDSVVSSTIDGSSSHTRPHLHLGSTDYQVGSVKANATGLLVAPSILRMGIEVEEDDTVLSGRPSPVSNVETTSNIIYATTRATIVVLDLRTMRILQTIENPRHHGPIGTFCVDWVMVALEVRPSAQSEGMVLINSWDIETTSLVETYETRESSPDTSTSTVQIGAAPSAISGIEAEKNPAATIAALTSAWTQPDVWAMVGGVDFSGLSGSTRSDAGIEHIAHCPPCHTRRTSPAVSLPSSQLSLSVQFEVDLSTRLSTAAKRLSSLPHSGHTSPASSLPWSQLSLLVQSEVDLSTRLSTAAKPLSSSGRTSPAASLPLSQISLPVQSDVDLSIRLSTAAKPLSSLSHSGRTSPAVSLPSSQLSLPVQSEVVFTASVIPPRPA